MKPKALFGMALEVSESLPLDGFVIRGKRDIIAVDGNFFVRSSIRKDGVMIVKESGYLSNPSTSKGRVEC